MFKLHEPKVNIKNSFERIEDILPNRYRKILARLEKSNKLVPTQTVNV